MDYVGENLQEALLSYALHTDAVLRLCSRLGISSNIYVMVALVTAE